MTQFVPGFGPSVVAKRVAAALAGGFNRYSTIKTGDDLLERFWWLWWACWRRDVLFGVAVSLFAVGSGIYAFAYFEIYEEVQQQYLAGGVELGWWVVDPQSTNVRPPLLYIGSHIAIFFTFIGVLISSRCRVGAVSVRWAVFTNLVMLWLLSLDAGAHLIPGTHAVWPSSLVAFSFINYEWLVLKASPRLQQRPRVASLLRRLFLLGIATSGFMAVVQVLNARITSQYSGLSFTAYTVAGLVDCVGCMFLACHAVRAYRNGVGIDGRKPGGGTPPEPPSPPPGAEVAAPPEVQIDWSLERELRHLQPVPEIELVTGACEARSPVRSAIEIDEN